MVQSAVPGGEGGNGLTQGRILELQELVRRGR